MESYAYTGDVKKLKSIGYTFQKLYAMNYKSYHKGEIFMFVTTKMAIEYGTLVKSLQAKFIEFILVNKDKPKKFWVEDKQCGSFVFNDTANFYLTMHGNVVTDEKRAKLRHISSTESFRIYDCLRLNEISQDQSDVLYEEWRKMEGAPDPFNFGWDRVQAILELNNLHPLEVVS